MPSPNLRQISREQLFRVFKDADLVRFIEDLISAVNDALPDASAAVQTNLDAHIADTGDAHQASAIGATPGGSRATNNVQGQLGELDTVKVPTSRTVNGKPLSSNITLTASDVGASNGYSRAFLLMGA